MKTHEPIENPNFTDIEWIRWDHVLATCIHCQNRHSYNSQHLRRFQSCGCLKKLRGIAPVVRIDGDIAFIQLTKGFEAMIDSKFAGLASISFWIALGKIPNVYAATVHAGKTIYLHRAVMNAPEDAIVDHIDGNRMDCRLSNLRFATHAENIRNSPIKKNNTSGLKGVTWSKAAKKWTSQIVHNGEKFYLGLFDTKELAFAAYCDASKKHHGEFGRIE